MKVLSAVSLALCGAFAFAPVARSQAPVPRSPGSQEDKVVVTVALQAGGSAYQVKGQGRCTHEPRAGIYATPAQQFRVEHRDGQRSVSLTFWRPAKSGSSDMFTMLVSNGKNSHTTSTVKVGDQGNPVGSGNVTFKSADKGGIFTINATAGDGTKITGTIACSAFTALYAEGGN
jgi:hypothetical protein